MSAAAASGHAPALALRAVESAADVARVAELAAEIWREYYPAIIGRDQTEYMVATLQSAAAITSQLRGAVRYFLLALGDATIGYAAVEPRPSALFVSKLYLLAGTRGRGIGQQALQLLAAHARAHGLGQLELTVNRNNTLALAAYARFGMAVVGEQCVDIGHGYAMDDYVLRAELGQAAR